MKRKVAIAYSTTEGHTARIARFIAENAGRSGVQPDVFHAAALGEGFSLEPFEAVIAGGSLHEGHHQRDLLRFVQRHVDWLNSHPSAFFSVSLSAADRKTLPDAERCAQQFLDRTGWKPKRVRCVAGALLYTEYAWWKRALMKHISGSVGGPTDTHQDYEMTDWASLEKWVSSFLSELQPANGAGT